MRYLVSLVCALALGVMPMVGCSDEETTGGTGGVGGEGGMGGSNSAEFPCTEQGDRDAIALGGGPHTFDCEGPTTITTADPIVVEKAVILDGENRLRIDYTSHDTLFKIEPGPSKPGKVELRGLTMGGLFTIEVCAWGVLNRGTLTLTNVTVEGYCLGVFNSGTLTLTDSTVSANEDGLGNEGTLTVVNTTVSKSSRGVHNEGVATLSHTTVSTELAVALGVSNEGVLTITNSLIDGSCEGDVTSGGYNIESPGDTCGLDHTGDQPGVTEAQLNLGPLADNGGPTQTHKPGDGGLGDDSFAIDQIPEADCEAGADQRGEPRPETGGTMCDVGAVEVQP